MPNILVTGATGFIGQALLRHLLADVHTTHHPIAAVRCNHPTLPTGTQYVSVGHMQPDTNWTPTLTNIDVIIHLAARAHIRHDTHADPLTAFRETNVAATLNLARQAASIGTKRFIFVSSIGVNGNQTFGTPFTAGDTPNPTEAYAISKYEAEEALRDLSSTTNMEIVTIRPPLVYGLNAPGNFGRLSALVASGIPLPFGRIDNTRSLVALPNLISLICHCISHPAAANQTFLVSDNEDLSTTKLLQLLATSLGKQVRLIPIPQGFLVNVLARIGKKDLAQRLCGDLEVDISKTRNLLDWEPPVSVHEAFGID